MKISSKLLLLLLFPMFILTNGCRKYSFTGTTLSPDLKTITINNILMGTAGGPANLSQSFTEKLKEYYQRNTGLTRKTVDADLFLEGTIISYEQSAAGQTSSDKGGQNKLTIIVEITFKNTKDDTQSFEKKEFSFFQTFPAEQTITQVEKALVPKILDQLVLEIFNSTAANW